MSIRAAIDDSRRISSRNEQVKVLSLYSIIDFGKYNGRSFCYILRQDPGYIIWLQENAIDRIDFSSNILAMAWLDLEEENPDDYKRMRKKIQARKDREAAAKELEGKVDFSNVRDLPGFVTVRSTPLHEDSLWDRIRRSDNTNWED